MEAREREEGCGQLIETDISWRGYDEPPDAYDGAVDVRSCISGGGGRVLSV